MIQILDTSSGSYNELVDLIGSGSDMSFSSLYYIVKNSIGLLRTTKIEAMMVLRCVTNS